MDELTTRKMLDFVMNRIKARSPQLAELVQKSIDEGKLIAERSQLKVINPDGRKSFKEHIYDRRIPLSDHEALSKVVLVLRAYLVELPLCTSAAFSELAMSEVALTNSRESSPPPLFQAVAVGKSLSQTQVTPDQQVLIERAHEGMLQRDAAVEPMQLNFYSSAVLEEQQKNLNALAQLLGVQP